MSVGLDLRACWRNLRRSPGFAAVAILSLALGIGANTAIFSLVEQVLLRSLPVADPGRLVILYNPVQPRGLSMSDSSEQVYSYPAYRDFRGRAAVFGGVAARGRAAVAVGFGGQTERAQAEAVTGNYFEVLGVQPFRGRFFSPDDDALEGGHPVAVLSHAYWLKRFGGDPAVLGQKITVSGHPLVVIGVVPPRFRSIVSGQAPDLYVPTAMNRQVTASDFTRENRGYMWLNIIGRLKPGVSLQQAEAALGPVFQPILEQELQRMNRPRGSPSAQRFLNQKLQLHPASQGINNLRRGMEKPLAALMAMVGFVLLIACFNVANLLLTRATGRQREIAVRLALGASRWALARMLLIESFLLALAGGVIGVLLSGWVLKVLLALLPDGMSGGWISAEVQPRLLLFALALSSATALIFGLIPALQATKPDLAPGLKDQASGAGGSRRQQRWRGALVVGQVALAFVLLSGAGLFGRSFANLLKLDPGYRTENLFSFGLDLRLSGYDRSRGLAFLQEVERRLAALPGVTRVAAANIPLLSNSNRGSNVTIEGYTPKEDESTNIAVNAVSAGYFSAMGIPVLMGREFTARDDQNAPKVVMVNERFAQRYFSGSSPIGRHMAFGAGSKIKLDLEIVGVVRNSKHSRLREDIGRFVYFPYLQESSLSGLTFYVRTGRDETATAAAVRGLIREMDSNVPLYNLKTMKTTLDGNLAQEKLVAALSSGFGALAMVLACVGLYGVIAYAVARRTGEIGIRMALGAVRGDVLWLVMRDVLVFLGVGMGIGLGISLALGRLIQSQLFGVPPHDLFVIGAAVLALSFSGLAAGLLPALRASRIDPMIALRYE